MWCGTRRRLTAGQAPNTTAGRISDRSPQPVASGACVHRNELGLRDRSQSTIRAPRRGAAPCRVAVTASDALPARSSYPKIHHGVTSTAGNCPAPAPSSDMTRPKVPPEQRQRTAQACEVCKRRKQKVSHVSSLNPALPLPPPSPSPGRPVQAPVSPAKHMQPFSMLSRSPPPQIWPLPQSRKP